MNEIEEMNTPLNTSEVYKPSEIFNILRNYINKSATKIIYIQGIYWKNVNNSDKWLHCYDILKDEITKDEITIVIDFRQQQKLKNGNLVKIGGILQRKIQPNGNIQLFLNVSRLEIVQEQAVSKEEIKKFEIRRLKQKNGFKNVDMILEDKLYQGIRPSVALIFASTSITMSDFEAGKNATSSQIDFTEHRVPFGNSTELSNFLKNIDLKEYDVISLIRGGGSGIESLDDLSVLEVVANLKTPLICAIGHVEENLFIKSIADKVAPTPNGLGSYFSELVERVSQKKNKSKAILIDQVRKQFIDQIQTANKQNKDLHEQLEAMRKSSDANQKRLTDEFQKMRLTNEQVNKNLNNQINQLNNEKSRLTKELNENKSKRFNSGCILILIIITLIFILLGVLFAPH
jgi:exodeoxyribonuclease VII large subunit